MLIDSESDESDSGDDLDEVMNLMWKNVMITAFMSYMFESQPVSQANNSIL